MPGGRGATHGSVWRRIAGSIRRDPGARATWPGQQFGERTAESRAVARLFARGVCIGRVCQPPGDPFGERTVEPPEWLAAAAGGRRKDGQAARGRACRPVRMVACRFRSEAVGYADNRTRTQGPLPGEPQPSAEAGIPPSGARPRAQANAGGGVARVRIVTHPRPIHPAGGEDPKMDGSVPWRPSSRASSAWPWVSSHAACSPAKR